MGAAPTPASTSGQIGRQSFRERFPPEEDGRLLLRREGPDLAEVVVVVGRVPEHVDPDELHFDRIERVRVTTVRRLRVLLHVHDLLPLAIFAGHRDFDVIPIGAGVAIPPRPL